MRKILARAIAVAFLVILLSAAGLLAIQLNSAYQGYSEPVVLYVEPGTSSRVLATELESRGVVSSRWLFLAARALRPRATLMAGEYSFEEPMSVRQVFDKFSQGLFVYHAFTIPEGYNRFEIAGVLEEEGFAGREDFLKETEDTGRVHDLFPQATSLEGFLFPDTYNVAYPFSAGKIADMMVEKFRSTYEQVTRNTSTSLSPGELVILASMIEKETGVESERRLVSSVFHNRLQRPMLMQCDPTVIYGMILEDRYNGRLLREDLDHDHPYNTYIHAGLPPGPIANPGRASLKAAAHPADSGYLYFVADEKGDGSHVFSESFQAHTRAVVAYRRSRKR